jgi:site-specific recombinase XerD
MSDLAVVDGSGRSPAMNCVEPEPMPVPDPHHDEDRSVNRRPEEDVMPAIPPLDRAGRRRSPATTSSFHQGVAPHNKGLRYPPDPPTVDEIIAVMRAAGSSPEGVRLRGVIVVLWRAGLRISEALALNETDLDADRGALLIRHGKGDKRREVGMDRWAWSHLEPWLKLRSGLPVGRLFCVVRGPTQGRPCAPAGIRAQLHQTALAAGVRRRFAPHQLRHAHAVEMSREGISLIVIQRQLGHADLAITSRYLRGIDNTEIIQAVHQRPEPMIPASRQLAPGR